MGRRKAQTCKTTKSCKRTRRTRRTKSKPSYLTRLALQPQTSGFFPHSAWPAAESWSKLQKSWTK